MRIQANIYNNLNSNPQIQNNYTTFSGKNCNTYLKQACKKEHNKAMSRLHNIKCLKAENKLWNALDEADKFSEIYFIRDAFLDLKIFKNFTKMCYEKLASIYYWAK